MRIYADYLEMRYRVGETTYIIKCLFVLYMRLGMVIRHKLAPIQASRVLLLFLLNNRKVYLLIMREKLGMICRGDLLLLQRNSLLKQKLPNFLPCFDHRKWSNAIK